MKREGVAVTTVRHSRVRTYSIVCPVLAVKERKVGRAVVTGEKTNILSKVEGCELTVRGERDGIEFLFSLSPSLCSSFLWTGTEPLSSQSNHSTDVLANPLLSFTFSSPVPQCLLCLLNIPLSWKQQIMPVFLLSFCLRSYVAIALPATHPLSHPPLQHQLLTLRNSCHAFFQLFRRFSFPLLFLFFLSSC